MASTRVKIPQEWRKEEGNVDEIIPKAVILFHETSEHKAKVDVLAFLCHDLLPKLSLSTLEKTLLCNIYPDLPLYVDSIFVTIENLIQLEDELGQNMSKNKSDLLHDILVVMLTVLQCIETCLKHINETFQCITINQINSLPVPVLLIVKSTFSHCQKSEASYGDLFSEVSQDLSLLFKKSFELQKLLLELLCVKTDALNTTSLDKDVQNITDVCETVLDICDITELFDGNMTPGMWKSLIRLLLKNKDIIKNYQQSDRVVSQMCSTLERKLQSYDYLVNSKDTPLNPTNETLSSKSLKVLKFLIKLLMSFVQNFLDFLHESSFNDVLQLISSIISVSYSSCIKPTMNPDTTKTALIIVVEPFLKTMLLNKKFAVLLTRLSTGTPPKNNFSQCYILANVVVQLPLLSEETASYWIKPDNFHEDEERVSVYEALLHSCNFCFVEMSFPMQLPGTMCNGKVQRMIGFYEYVVSRFSASISAISSENFQFVETILLKSVIGENKISSSIAIDVWCFMARWMTADICYSQVKLFLHWLTTVSWKSELQKKSLCTLVRRILPFVAQEHQELLFQEYPPGSLENMNIWSIIPVHKMIESIRTMVVKKIVHCSNSMLQQWFDKNLSRSELETIVCCLQNMVIRLSNLDCLPNDTKSNFVFDITRLFDSFMVVPKTISDSCWVNFLNILKSLLTLLQPQDFEKALSNMASAVDLFKDEILSIHFARVMAECGKLRFPIGQNESALISRIFRTLITSNHWLVHNEAFTSLRQFAELTPYTPVLGECVPDDMKQEFQKFICTIPYGCQEGEDGSMLMLNLLRKQEMQRANKVAASDKRKREIADKIDGAKRAKVDSHHISKDDEAMLLSSVAEISKHLLVLQNIHSTGVQLPLEVLEKLRPMKTLLDTLRDHEDV